MKNIYIKAKSEIGYQPTRFLQILSEKGGINTARILVSSKSATYGLETLWKSNRLDLSVEALVLKPEYYSLFSDDIKEICRKRLADYGYIIQANNSKDNVKIKISDKSDYIKLILSKSIIPTVASLRHTLNNIFVNKGDISKLPSWEKLLAKNYKLGSIINELLENENNNDALVLLIRGNLLKQEIKLWNGHPFDIFVVGYISEITGGGKIKFKEWLFENNVTDKENSVNAVWQVGKGDGVFLNLLEEDGRIKDRKFFEQWVEALIDNSDIVTEIQKEAKHVTAIENQQYLIRNRNTGNNISFNNKVNDIILNHEKYHDAFCNANIFSGPSLYFHRKAIEYVDSQDLVRQCEYIYATLTSWGMHRMGKIGAKMQPFDVFMESIKKIRVQISIARKMSIRNVDFEILKNIFVNIKVMLSGTRIVGNSKVMAHLIPNLIPPVDRAYTLRYITGNTNVINNIEAEWKILRELLEFFFYPIVANEQLAEIIKEWICKQDEYPWDTSALKVVDNLLIGAMSGRDNGRKSFIDYEN